MRRKLKARSAQVVKSSSSFELSRVSLRGEKDRKNGIHGAGIYGRSHSADYKTTEELVRNLNDKKRKKLAACVERWLQKRTKDQSWVDSYNIQPGLLRIFKCSLF